MSDEKAPLWLSSIEQELFNHGWIPARRRYLRTDHLRNAIQKSKRRIHRADDGMIQMALILESPGFSDIFQARLDEVNGKLSEEEGNNLAEIIKLTIGAIRDWHAGSASAFLKLEAVRKVLTAERWNLDHAKLKEIADFDQSHHGDNYAELARGLDLLYIMAAISAIVEPKSPNEVLKPESYVIESRDPLPSVHYVAPKIWEMTRRFIKKRNQTLQSLAIRAYKELLKEESVDGIDPENHDFMPDIKTAIEWGNTNRKNQYVQHVVFNGGASYPYMAISDKWKKRGEKTRKQTSQKLPKNKR